MSNVEGEGERRRDPCSRRSGFAWARLSGIFASPVPALGPASRQYEVMQRTGGTVGNITSDQGSEGRFAYDDSV